MASIAQDDRHCSGSSPMKKYLCGTVIGLVLLSLGACAIPKKTQVQSPGIPAPVKKSQIEQPLEIVTSEPAPLPPSGPLSSESLTRIEEEIPETMPSLTFINDRIFEYGRKLERWKALDSQAAQRQVKDQEAAEMVRCFRKLQTVLNGYSDLRGRLLQTERMSTGEKIGQSGIIDLGKGDIDFLESSCGRMLAAVDDQSAGWSQREETADLAQIEALIARHAEQNELEEIVNVWQRIPAAQLGRVDWRAKINYGNALMMLRNTDQAAEIYKQVVEQMSAIDAQATDLVSMRRTLADLYTAAGNYRAAAAQYKQISSDYTNLGKLEEWSKLQLSILERSQEGGPELREYSSLLREFLSYRPDKSGYKLLWQAENFLTKYPYSPVASNVDVIKERVNAAAEKWFAAFMSDVEKLRDEKRFQEAQDLLKTLPADIIGPEKQLVLKGKNEELSLTDAVERESQRMALMEQLQNRWNEGMVLAKAEKFDEALAVFATFAETEYALKAQEKIKELSLEAAKADRKKAANLFTRYTKTSDPESRKKLLLETHKLLRNILVKYPEVDLKSKVAGNLQRVEQELMAIDPRLLVQAQRGEDLDEDLSFPDGGDVGDIPPIETGDLPVTP
jgi:tetratricopeptide (TPR) repeat protein